MSFIDDFLSTLGSSSPDGAMPIDYFTKEPLTDSEVAKRLQSSSQQVGMLPQGQIPFGALGIGGMSGLLSAPALSPPVTAAVGADLPPPANDPTSGQPTPYQNGVPLPQPRPAAADNPATFADRFAAAPTIPSAPLSLAPPMQDDALPADSTPTSGNVAIGAPAGPDQAGGGLSSILNKVLNPQNAGMLLALGSGFAGAPSFGTGMQRAFGAAAAPAAALAQRNQTVDLLVKRGMSPDMARLAASNPAALNQILPNLMGAKQWQMGEKTDAFGQKTPFLYDPVSGATKQLSFDNSNNPSSALPAPANAGNGQPSSPQIGNGRPTMENFSMDKVDPKASGWDYLKQFPPEVEAATRDYMSGGVMPSGNPRSNGIATMAKMAAQKVAMDLGNPALADDSLYSQRRTMRTSLAGSGPTSLGGILSNGKSAFDHLADLSDKYADLGNTNGPNIPAGGHIATAENWVGNSLLPTTQTQGKLKAAAENALRYGQESTKFYAGTGGGEGERMAALNANNPATTSGNEQAAFLQTEKGLMLDRLREKENQIRDTLGDDFLARHPVMTPDLQASLSRIDGNIAKLTGNAPAAAPANAPITASGSPAATPGTPAAPAAATPTLVRQNGHVYQRQGDGSYRAVQ